jgi:formylglycine-generating enzyme required for sulfatase activity
MKKFSQTLLFTTLALLLCTPLWAQLAVESFVPDLQDQSARITNKRIDQNDKTCAIVKIETPLLLQDFSFDAGMTAVAHSEQRTGEVWLWLSPGARRVSISHKHLGTVRNYEFGEGLREATVYIMKLKSGTVRTVVEEAVTLQYLEILCPIEGATINIDEAGQEPFTDGKFQKLLSYGRHKYTIEAPLYHPLPGMAEVSADKQPPLKAELKPAFGKLTVNTQPEQGADVFIDGEKRGQTPLTLDKVRSGEHAVRVIKTLYFPTTQTATVSDGQTATENIVMKPNFAALTFKADGDIYVNDNRKAANTWTERLSPGNYKVEVHKASHRSTLTTIEAKAGETRTIDLEAPTPIYGSLDISSNVTAQIAIDGQAQQSATPVLLNKILTGKHEITLQADGYQTYKQTVDVIEGKIAAVKATLQVPEKVQPVAQDSKSEGFEMVFVQGGTFTMGCNNCESYEKPTHQVILSSFNIGKYEVTQAQWKAIMGENPSYFKGDKLPVETVSWDDVQDFIRRLNAQTGKKYRLPTEAEWEYAARGGSKSRGYKYSGSNTIGDVAWYDDNSGSTTHAVGTKSANELGIYDMSGNVWEWCSDWYGSYSSGAQSNPTGASSGSARVSRGGSWRYDAAYSAVSYRDYTTPSYRSFEIGFRLVVLP